MHPCSSCAVDPCRRRGACLRRLGELQHALLSAQGQPVSHQADAAHATPCCTQADTSAGIGSGCRFDQHNLALPAGGETGPVIAAVVAAVVLENPMRRCASTPAARCVDLSPPDTPLYLRLQTLLI